jgi:hypothetical protein
VPKFVEKKEIKDQYKLYFCPFNVYMFMTYFYSVYERVIMAQELVQRKVEQDFLDDFSKNEWGTKFQNTK